MGSIVNIPGINSPKTDLQLPFKFRRRQSQVRLAFAMTVNQSQGQTLAKAGLYLPTHCFSHSQLYVAKSRVKSRKALHVVVSCGQVEGRVGVYTKNIVQKIFILHFTTCSTCGKSCWCGDLCSDDALGGNRTAQLSCDNCKLDKHCWHTCNLSNLKAFR